MDLNLRKENLVSGNPTGRPGTKKGTDFPVIFLFQIWVYVLLASYKFVENIIVSVDVNYIENSDNDTSYNVNEDVRDDNPYI